MAKSNTTDIELLAGLSIDSSEQEILKAIKIIQKRLKANHDARFKLNVDIDETVISNTITKLQNALKSKDLKIETKDSILAITKEANAMLDVVSAAKKASVEKLEFMKANRQVRDSANDTADAINRERTAMNNLDDLDTILQNINMSGRQGGSVFQQFGETLRNAFSVYTMANLLEQGTQKVVSAGKEALETVKEFDDINVDLQMATGADKDYVKGLISDYAELGGELGALTQTVAESADTFLRQGRSMEETNQLIRDAVVLSKVAQTEGDKASEILTATINGFQLAATEGSRVNDVLSSIDLNSASSAEGIGIALTKVASMANSAGMSLEKTAAIAAVLKETTMDADQTIGTSMKTMLSRMNSIRAGKFVDEETGEALNDVEKVLNKIGITMRNEVTGQFKEAEVIIDEVGKKWATFDENSKKAAQFALGGAYQANKVVALFDNYEKVLELTKIAEESAGVSLQKFNDSYLSSLESKTNALKSSLQSLATSTVSDELYASVLDTTKAIVDMTTETGILKGALAGLGTAGAIYAFQHLATYMRDATQEFANLGEAMQITRGANGTITDIQRLIDLTGGLSQSQTRLLLSTNNLTDAQKIAVLMNQYLAQGMDDDLARATAEATLRTWGLTTAQNAATGAGITLRNTLRGIGATLMANPLILVATAVTIGVTAFNKYNQAQEEMREQAKQAANEANNLGDEITELASKYIALSEAVGTDVGAKENLISTQTELLKKLGMEGASIDELTAKYGSLSNAIRQASIDALKNAQIDLLAGIDVAREELLKAGKDGLFGKKSIAATGEDAGKAWQVLEDAGIITAGMHTSRGGEWFLPGDDSVEGIIQNYEALGKALNALRDSAAFEGDELSGNSLFKELYSRYNDLKDEVDAYNSSIQNLNENLAQQTMLTSLQGRELPKTEDEFNAFKQELIATAIASKSFIGTEEEITNAVTNYLATVPEFAKYFSIQAEEVAETAETLAIQISDIFAIKDSNDNATALANYKDQLLGVENAYRTCLSAKEEYDEQGYLSVDTLEKVLSLGDDYLQYLFDEQGNVKLDAEAFKELSLARINDMEAQALSNLAQNIRQIKDEATATQYLATEQNKLANSYTDVAINALMALRTISGFSDSEALQSAYNSFKVQYEQIKGLFASTRKGLGSTYSGISDSKQKEREQLQEEAKRATKEYIESYMDFQKKSLEKGVIDYNTYCNTVSNLLKNMFKEGKISAEEYHNYTKDLLESELDLYDKAVSGMVHIIDREIDSLEKEQELIRENYESKIQSIQSEIDLLNELNNSRREQIDLQKSQYELERAKNQNVNMTYINGQIVYTEDSDEIRDKQSDIADKKHQIAIAELEKKIESLEKAMESEIKTIDKEINKYEDYKKKIQEVTEVYENAENVKYALAVTGLKSETDILQCRIDILNNFKDNYISIQKAISDAAWNAANEQNKANESVVNKIPSTTTPNVEKKQEPQGFKPESGKYYLYNKSTGKIMYETAYDSFESGQKALGGGKYLADSSSTITLKKFHTGIDMGYVGDEKSKDNRLQILQKAGNGELLKPDEVPFIAKKSELVFTEPQQINLVKTIMQGQIVPNISMPDYSHLNNLPIKNNVQPISIGEINLNCTGITGEEAGRKAFEVFQSEVRGMHLKANQQMSRTR